MSTSSTLGISPVEVPFAVTLCVLGVVVAILWAAWRLLRRWAVAHGRRIDASAAAAIDNKDFHPWSTDFTQPGEEPVMRPQLRLIHGTGPDQPHDDTPFDQDAHA